MQTNTHQESDDSRTGGHRQEQAEGSQQQAHKAACQNTYDDDDHAGYREEDLPPVGYMFHGSVLSPLWLVPHPRWFSIVLASLFVY